MRQIIVIGCGPAGVSAALYVKRSNLNVTIIGGKASAVSKAEKIENYYGFSEPITGVSLFEGGILQAQNLGCKLILDEVVGIALGGQFCVRTSKSGEFFADALVVATGRQKKRPQLERLEEFEGRGVSYCAICDAFFYRQKKVVVIGNGAYALAEAQELAAMANVIILTNGPASETVKSSKLAFLEAQIAGLIGENRVEGILFEDGTTLEVAGVFVAVGSASSLDFAKKIGLKTDASRIITDENQATNFPGVFAAGDCCARLSQIAIAVAQGAVAGLSAASYVRQLEQNLKESR